ncbi:hypothetical protein [Anaerovibrio sp.]|uniref:hypothetical protein n=1 Tax=Anaerovibrio sp. TaxID=1872532 RepID=UPI003F1482EB
MAVSKLEKGNDGKFSCPECGQALEYLSGGQVRIVDGKVDYDNVKPKYICRKCGKYYRELLNTGYYDVFFLLPEDLAELDRQQAEEARKEAEEKKHRKKFSGSPVTALLTNAQGGYDCPVCGKAMVHSEGGAVRIVNGKVDYENVKPRYICYDCGTFYRELLRSGLYEVFELPEEERTPPPPPASKPKRRIKSTGELAPMQLKRDANGHCECPRCGASMRFLEPGAVKIVDGRADMSDTVARFKCDECDSLYRRIATTNYFQWSEK